MNPSRIAILLPNLRPGGAERSILNLAEELSKAGYPVDLVIINKTGELLNIVPSLVNLVDLNSINEYTCVPALLHYLREYKPKILLSTLILANLISILTVRLTRTKTRLFLRSAITLSKQERSSTFKKWLERFLVHYLYPLSDGIIAVSNGVADDLVEYAGLNRDQIKVIYNPIKINQILKNANQSRLEENGNDRQIPIILSVGRLESQKDFPTLLRAFAIVKRITPAKLIILGEGSERGNLEKLINSLEIVRDVELPGFVPNPENYISKADVYVLSSLYEGLPNSLIEAMVCGCPVVSTDCQSGPAEILNGGMYGHLVPVGDAKRMADAISSVLEGEKRTPPSGWLEQFHPEKVARQYLEVFYKIP